MKYRLIFERTGQVTCKDSFGRIIWVIVKELRDNIKILTDKDRKVLTQLLNQTLRQFTDDQPEYISKKVANVLFNKSLGTDPFKMSEYMRGRIFGKGIYRTVVFEHTTPIKQLLDYMMLEAKDVNDICEALFRYSGTALITTEEDDCLTRKGARTFREDWKDVYISCDIELLDPEQFANYKTQNSKRFNITKIESDTDNNI